MNDDRDQDEIEPRLRAMLDARVADVHSDLSGPRLRARTVARPPRTRRVLPAAASAATVAAIAIVVAVVATDDRGGPAPVTPAGPGATTRETRPAVSSDPTTTAPVSPVTPTITSVPAITSRPTTTPTPSSAPRVGRPVATPTPNPTRGSVTVGSLAPARPAPSRSDG